MKMKMLTKFLLQSVLAGLVWAAAPKVKMGILLSGEGWKTSNLTFPAALVAIKEIGNWDVDPIDIDWKVEISGCDVPTSFVAIHQLLVWGAKVIIGPSCTTTCMPVAMQALQYGVPVISYACSGTGLSDRSKYPNFARTSESLQGASKLARDAFEKWKFELYSVMTTTQTINVDLAIEFVTEMRTVKGETGDGGGKNNGTGGDAYKLKQLSTVVSGLAGRNDAVRNGTLEQLDSFLADSWVFFLPMYDGDAGFILKNAAKEAAKTSGVDETEAWQKTNYAWFRYQSFVSEDMAPYYEGIFSLENDNPSVTYRAEYENFLKKFEDDPDILKGAPDALPLYLAYMYNAIIAWATAYNKVKTTDYEPIMGALANLQYTGAYREEVLDDLAEPKNAIWNIRQFQDGKFVDVVVQNPDDAHGITVKEDNIRWPNGKKVDPCKDGRCRADQTNNTVMYIVIAVCLFLVVVVIAVAGFIVYRQRKAAEDDRKIDWKIPFTELDFAVKKSVSGSRKFLSDEKPSNVSVAKYNHNYVVVKNLNVSCVSITKELLEDIYNLKKLTHTNLELFYGLCDDPGYCSVVTEYCSKGSLEDLAHNETVQLDWMFKLSLINDVAKGLKHLHTSQFGYHGNLRTSLCVVDSHWVCKITDFGLKNLNQEIDQHHNLGEDNMKTARNPRDLFYSAPELLWPTTKTRTIKELQRCDSYSFALVMYELFAREAPYDTSDILPGKIINRIRNRESPPFRPNIDLINITDRTSYEQVGAEDSAHAIPREAVEVMRQCWKEMSFERTNMLDAAVALEDMNPDRSLSITDRVVKMMEKYSEDLENKVARKTEELQNQQSGRNLDRFLPRKLIERIENGLELEPAANKYVTGACARILLDGEMDHIASLNSFEEICQTEIESRDIYQVIDSSGQPVVISGLYNESEVPAMILEYATRVHEEATKAAIKVKIVIHSGVTSGGMIIADSTNPRICITGSFSSEISYLIQQSEGGGIVLTDAAKRDLPSEMNCDFLSQMKICGNNEMKIYKVQKRNEDNIKLTNGSAIEQIMPPIMRPEDTILSLKIEGTESIDQLV